MENIKESFSDFIKNQPEINSILSVPEAGWTKLQFTKEEHELSWLTSVPLQWLDAAIYGMKTGDPFTVWGDQESEGKVYCTVTQDGCYVFEEYNYRDVEYVWLFPEEFCRLLYKDISENIDAWVKEWDIGDTPEESRRLIQGRLDELEGVFKENREKARRDLNQRIRDAMNGDGWGLVVTDESLIDDDLIDEWHAFCERREEMFEEKRKENNQEDAKPDGIDFIGMDPEEYE